MVVNVPMIDEPPDDSDVKDNIYCFDERVINADKCEQDAFARAQRGRPTRVHFHNYRVREAGGTQLVMCNSRCHTVRRSS